MITWEVSYPCDNMKPTDEPITSVKAVFKDDQIVLKISSVERT